MLERRSIRVLMYAEYPYNDTDCLRGGVINAVQRLVNGLSKLKDLELFVLSRSNYVNGYETKQINNARIIYFPTPNKGYDPLLLYYGHRHALMSAIKEIKPDILHAQGNAEFILPVVLSDLPHIVTIHGILKNELRVAKHKLKVRGYFKWLITFFMEKFYLKRIINLIAITPEIEDFVKKSSPAVNIYRINNALDDTFFKIKDTSDSDKIKILFVAAITYRKGLHHLIEACSMLKEHIPNVQLRIVGMFDWDPEYVKSLQMAYKQEIDEGSVVFLGGVPNEALYEEFSKCTLFCLPSFAESAPMVIAQAHAAGKPVIATNVGGVPDMIQEEETGYIVPVKNTNELHLALKKLLSNPQKMKEMGAKARLVAMDRYSSESVAHQTLQAYHDIITMHHKEK